MPTQVVKGSVTESYTYDGDGARVKKTTVQPDPSPTPTPVPPTPTRTPMPTLPPGPTATPCSHPPCPLSVNPQGDTPDSGLTSGDAGLAAAAATPTVTVAPIGGMDGAGVNPQATAAQTTVTLYIGGVLEYTGSSVVSSYMFGGKIVASRSSVGTPTTSNPGTLTYIHTDHLGSVSASSTAAGTIGPAQDFDPWGAPRSGSITATSRTYTGQIKDAGTGLLYYNARYYDPVLARFVSADSIVPNTSHRSLTVDFHEPGFSSALASENAQGFWFQMSRPARQRQPRSHVISRHVPRW